eukprot:SAG31_NODE_1565_length_7868_cov_27.758914_8_plen_67_part_00
MLAFIVATGRQALWRQPCSNRHLPCQSPVDRLQREWHAHVVPDAAGSGGVAVTGGAGGGAAADAAG